MSGDGIAGKRPQEGINSFVILFAFEALWRVDVRKRRVI
jgi:hypothetical protein